MSCACASFIGLIQSGLEKNISLCSRLLDTLTLGHHFFAIQLEKYWHNLSQVWAPGGACIAHATLLLMS